MAKAAELPDDDLRSTAQAWLAADPDPQTRDELQQLVDRSSAGDDAATADLRDRFSGRLAFGTAGLRAELGAGPMRMNRVVVRQAAAGLMRYLGAGATVVVGFDARHNSHAFAIDTARVVAGAGGRALLLPVVTPTPLLAFAVRHQRADAGVMCTASHNPPRDNGYKVYLGDGAQIIPPIDVEIASCIDDVAASGEAPVLATDDDEGIVYLDREPINAYLRHVVTMSPPGPRDISIVYTPMHGVGRDIAVDALRRRRFTDIHEVVEQAEPDPDFPTVAFPNPEEPGALDLAIALAERVHADVVIANDPDADRLGVAVPAMAGDGWSILSGNEIGALLGDHVLSTTAGDDRLVVSTFVSSRLLSKMAAAHGVHHREVLTGFKWVVRPAIEDPSLRFVFGFEEALGFSVDGYVRDKDGISSAATFCELLAGLAHERQTVWDRLAAIAVRHGHHATRTWSVRFTGPTSAAHQQMRDVMQALRALAVDRIGTTGVARVIDMASGQILPPTDAVVLELADDARLVARPSGTEPKVKVYAEVIVEVAGGESGYAAARQRGDLAIAALLDAFAAELGLPSPGPARASAPR